MKLFCLPYAGGTERIYYSWKRELGKRGVECIPVSLKGRARRVAEEYYSSIQDAVEDIYEQISDMLDEDYVIFGHSMGALLSYELYQKIARKGKRLPNKIIFSSHRPPYNCKRKEILHMLPDKEFMQKVYELGGTPKEIVEEPDLVEYFAPILKADFKILEEYEYREYPNKIVCPVYTFNGQDDTVSQEEMSGWNLLCQDKVTSYVFEGNHFFINTDSSNVISTVRNIIKE